MKNNEQTIEIDRVDVWTGLIQLHVFRGMVLTAGSVIQGRAALWYEVFLEICA